VVEQRQGLPLADEALAAIGAELERLVEHFHGDRPVELEVVAAPHSPHAAFADLVEHLDPASQDAARSLFGHEVWRVAVLVEHQAVRVITLAVLVLILVVLAAVHVLVVTAVAGTAGEVSPVSRIGVIENSVVQTRLRHGITTTAAVARPAIWLGTLVHAGW
jgi:hypothetical protein